MSLWIFLKVLGDICLYFSVVSMFPGLFDFDFSFLFPALLSAAGVGLSVVLIQQGKEKLRWLCMVLPLAALALADSTIELLILIPALVYTFLMILRGLAHMEYYSYQEYFKRSLTIWTVAYGVIWLMFYFEGMSSSDRGILDAIKPLGCMAVYALCGVFLLRQLRMGDARQGSTALNGVQLTAVLIGGGICAWGFVAVERWLVENQYSLLKLIKDLFIGLITAPIAFLADLITDFFLALESVNNDALLTTESSVAATTSAERAVPVETAVIRQTMTASEDSAFPWWLAILILAVLTVVLTFVLRILGDRVAREHAIERTEKVVQPKGRRETVDKSNRARVRKLYRGFLKRERSRGVRLNKYDTSQQILGKISDGTDPSAAKKLRQVYLLARYDDMNEVTDDQLSDAQAAWNEIRQGKKK